MKRFLFILLIFTMSSTLFSCDAGRKATTSQDAVVFSTKDKKEVVKQSILNTKKKTYIAAP